MKKKQKKYGIFVGNKCLAYFNSYDEAEQYLYTFIIPYTFYIKEIEV